MSESDDDKGGKNNPPEPPSEIGRGEIGSGEKRSGRVGYDSRGNPIWEWQLETGVYSRDVTTQKLRKLDMGDLSIADSGIYPKPTPDPQPAAASRPGGDPRQKGLTPAAPTAKPAPPPRTPASSGRPSDAGTRPGGGFNPYDRSSSPVGGGSNPYDNTRPVADRLKPEAQPERRRTPADMRKLDEMIKEQRKKLKE